MKRNVILRHEDATPPGGRPAILVIGDGFALLAFLFPIVWLLWHRLWIAGAAAFAVYLSIVVFAQQPQWALIGLPLNLLMGLYVGLEGPGWRIGAARGRGYHIADIIEAETRDDAELRLAVMQDDPGPEPALRAEMVPGRGLAAAEAPDFLFAPPAGVGR